MSRRSGRRGTRSVELWLGVAVLVAITVLSFVAPQLTGHGPDEFVGAPFEPPSSSFWFGTDSLGRDVFVRTFTAAHVDYVIAGVGVIVSLMIGTALGVLAGSARSGVWGTGLMRITDALIAVPFPLIILMVVVGIDTSFGPSFLPPGVMQVLFAVFIVDWAIYARLSRAETSSLRGRDFIVAASLMGYSRSRIVLRHIAPHVAATKVTYAVADAVLIVGFAASLPFLGAGIPPPTAEWGTMMYEGRGVLDFAWWLMLFPGLALAMSAVAAAFIADSLLARQGRSGMELA